ncbi:hypothetical protein [Streptomyces sp. 6N223]|uniref:hypothetical protein n=1 Tax=Streptomyces sp. 6N223 TaxID=3457412 RepID=UPI003FCFFD73
MYSSKTELHEQVAWKVTQVNPTDRVLVVFPGRLEGAILWFLDIASIISIVFDFLAFTRRNCVVALTEQEIIVIPMTRFNERLKAIKYRMSWPQAAALMGEVKEYRRLRSTWFLFAFPGKRRAKRITVAPGWKNEFRYFLSVIRPAQAKG